MTTKGLFFISYKLSGKIEMTAEGFLVCRQVPIMAAGEYPDDGGKRVVILDELDLFNESTLSSFHGKPFTIGHPPPTQEGEMVTSENWAKLAHGHLDKVCRGTGEHAHCIVADIFISTEDGKKKIFGEGTEQWKDVSAGFNCAQEEVDGKFRLTKIMGNHVALVPVGRAGEQCSIQFSQTKTGETEMATNEGKGYEDGVLAGIGKFMQMFASHKKNNKAETDDADADDDENFAKKLGARMDKMEKALEKMASDKAEHAKAESDKDGSGDKGKDGQEKENMGASLVSEIQATKLSADAISKITGGKDLDKLSVPELTITLSAAKSFVDKAEASNKEATKISDNKPDAASQIMTFRVSR